MHSTPLDKNINVEWLLNYHGGSFLFDAQKNIEKECRLRGVSYRNINASELIKIYSTIEQSNMDIILLEKKPEIAIYTPPNKQPWDDAVTLALTYAEITYKTLWDEEVYLGELDKYDWLHLHHEDFTGQYGKFYRSHHNSKWYKEQKKQFEETANKLGFESVHEQKKGIAKIIKSYVGKGGFLFAMCSATDSYDIALSMGNLMERTVFLMARTLIKIFNLILITHNVLHLKISQLFQIQWCMNSLISIYRQVIIQSAKGLRQIILHYLNFLQNMIPSPQCSHKTMSL